MNIKNKTYDSFQVAGIALIVSGSFPLMKIEGIRDVLPEENPAMVPILVIVLGSIVFTISFFGCCGAIRESQCMVSTVIIDYFLRKLRIDFNAYFSMQCFCSF